MTAFLSSALVLAGAIIAGISTIGLLRFPDVLTRMHAASKPQTVGMILFLVGVAIDVGSVSVAALLAMVGLAQMVTVPASSAMVGRAAFRRGFIHDGEYAVDELSPRLAMGGEPDDDDDGFIDEYAGPGDADPASAESLPDNRFIHTSGMDLAELKSWAADSGTDGRVDLGPEDDRTDRDAPNRPA
ncbi:monovalent cation/H(+) antiporter subunit G [Helcobacillus massiliensis]|uniref:monovalent cation/H(+) antiporter subunit G n=1 Tax=Helcobacillus TaxID=1161125 RepID=UPI001EF4012C|nr:monovalent cation/H(+) antiporter subunit G [Helcobacillus massiliensis]MCG7427262.1 monovalent cation/H(+) antiporter subunit G [Helcobacillus sp. ACRRO]MCT1556553.1 monovalent cation/H(+) antiporter subunit G [Helcobacillus massiliensis]MCT2035747.1 monovalent cation/H(+) antiporter subunit G [Helcobacillus massiliensis]MCT2331171.1 monovalent cation/H(+) antiporter subunit G [Helcobacillus massiliensis]MDK7741950.1 monovalent cation/H(+) antiporter subunit G [Helcobacillus massiliensis]